MADLPGHVLPNWAAVTQHVFEPHEDDCLVLDTSAIAPSKLMERCVAYAEAAGA